ncbi:MAG: ferrous iron transporter B, partial [bacterium]
PPCFAAIGAMNSEMQSKKWLLGGVGLQFGVAYVLSFFTYQIGTLITIGSLGEGFLVGLVVVLVIIGIVIGLIKSSGKNIEEYKLNTN